MDSSTWIRHSARSRSSFSTSEGWICGETEHGRALVYCAALPLFMLCPLAQPLMPPLTVKVLSWEFAFSGSCRLTISAMVVAGSVYKSMSAEACFAALSSGLFENSRDVCVILNWVLE